MDAKTQGCPLRLLLQPGPPKWEDAIEIHDRPLLKFES